MPSGAPVTSIWTAPQKQAPVLFIVMRASPYVNPAARVSGVPQKNAVSGLARTCEPAGLARAATCESVRFALAALEAPCFRAVAAHAHAAPAARRVLARVVEEPAAAVRRGALPQARRIVVEQEIDGRREHNPEHKLERVVAAPRPMPVRARRQRALGERRL